MDHDSRLHITGTLLECERGKGELLLADYADLRPLYIRKGRGYVRKFLRAAAELKSRRKLVEAFPGDAALLDMLIRHGIIIPAGSPEKTKTQKPEELQLKGKNSISLYLLLSQSCNLSCIYCLNGARTYRKDQAPLMSAEVAFKSVERCLEDLHPQGFLEIVFFGGEPLMNWPLAKEVILRGESALGGRHAGKRIRYHITTNLTLLPDDLIEWSKRYGITFLCNVDGPPEIHDKSRPFKNGNASHEAIAKNIRRLSDAGLWVSLRTTITSLNDACLPEISRHHQAIGGKSSAFVPVNPVNSDEDILVEKLLPSPGRIIRGMADLYRSRLWQMHELYPFNQHAERLMPGSCSVVGCGAPYGNTPVVDVNGDVYPCIYLVGMKRFHIGNILNGSYPDRGVLNGMYGRLHVDRREDCRECPWRYLCGGGCALGRLTVFDNPAASHKVREYCRRITCDYTKSMLELMLWDKAQEAAFGLLETEGRAAHRSHDLPGPDAFIC